jgi:hypothetical protein
MLHPFVPNSQCGGGTTSIGETKSMASARNKKKRMFEPTPLPPVASARNNVKANSGHRHDAGTSCLGPDSSRVDRLELRSGMNIASYN